MLRFISGLLLMLITCFSAGAQVVVAFQGGEGTSADNWNFTPITNAGGPMQPGVVAALPRSGSHAIRAGGGNNTGCSGGANCLVGGQATGCAMHGKIVTFDAVNITCLSDVQITCYHRTPVLCGGGGNGFDSGEGLHFEVRLNGGAWTTVGSLAGFNDLTWSYTSSPVGNGPTVTNPFVYNVPAGTNTVQFRVRGVLNRSDEVFYLDDVSLTTSTNIYNFPATAGLWNGEISSDWHNPCNWDARTLPTTTTDVLIPASANNICEVLPGNTASSRNLTIDHTLAVESFTSTINVLGNLEITSGGFLDMSLSGNEGGTMNLHGNWINRRDESFFDEGKSTVSFSGASNQMLSVDNDVRESFFKLNLNKTGGTVLAADDIHVDGSNNAGLAVVMNITGGMLELDGHELFIGNDFTGSVIRTGGGVISERFDNSSRIRRNTGANTGNFIFPLIKPDGTYIPFIFNQTAGNAGMVTVSTYSTPADNLPWPSTPVAVTNLASFIGLMPDNRDATVDRFWHIDVNGASTADLTFSYAPAELPAAPYDNPLSLGAQRYDESSAAWSPYTPAQGASYFFVQVPSVNTFETWTLSNNISPLPVELLLFDAHLNDAGAVDLKWTTASETDNDFFTIEKTKNGHEFEEVTRIAGAGNSTSSRNYQTTDASPWSGVSYYRLKQTDFSGAYSYSDLVRINNTADGTNSELVIYPNPASEFFYFMTGTGNSTENISIYNALGELVHKELLHSNLENRAVLIDVENLPRGMYLVRSDSGRVQRLVIR